MVSVPADLSCEPDVLFVSWARFESTPVAPVDPTDRGLTDPRDIEPLAVVPDDLGVPPSDDASLGSPDAGTAAVDASRDMGTRVAAGGSISVRATPWASVVLDGRALGTTPIRRTAVSSGSHTIRLECPPLGRHVDATFRVEGGRATSLVADLDRDPPTLRVSP